MDVRSRNRCTPAGLALKHLLDQEGGDRLLVAVDGRQLARRPAFLPGQQAQA